MARIVVSALNVANFPEGGGRLWAYMQYVLGLRQCGCEVWWLERFVPTGDPVRDVAAPRTFFERMAAFDLTDRAILLYGPDPTAAPDAPAEVIGMSAEAAAEVFRRADMLLNFDHTADPGLLRRFRRTALVDIDPGLLQFWVSRGQLALSPHNFYFTTGETVGTSRARFPDCGVRWVRIRPPVCLERWPMAPASADAAMTTVSDWDGGDWVVDGETAFENTQRMSFLRFKGLPRLTAQPLELALALQTETDAQDRRLMEQHGWRIRHSRDVAATPQAYQAYIQGSRGEFSCAKPSSVVFQNAWVSDRTLCYLASGKPVVVQNTGPSAYLPNGEGMFRFSTLDEAAAALSAINDDYARHSEAARELAETYFDARHAVRRILQVVIP